MKSNYENKKIQSKRNAKDKKKIPLNKCIKCNNEINQLNNEPKVKALPLFWTVPFL